MLRSMSPAVAALTLLCVVGISAGQILFKKAAVSMQGAHHWNQWVCNGWLIAALALYGVTTLAWVWVLKHVPLHLAYPFMGLAYLLVPLFAWMVLGENLGWRTWAGNVLILAGIATIASAS